MVDFAKALQEGMSAAEKAQIARTEITSVFADINDQISAITNGKVKIHTASLQKERKLFEILMPPEIYLGIVAENPTIKNCPKKEIAKWHSDNKGYPCKVAWAGYEVYCEDKEALESCLAELLRDPKTAETLSSLSRMKPNNPEDKASQS